MKKASILFGLMLVVSVLAAQAPEAFTLQMVVRNNGNVLSNTTVGVRTSIRNANTDQLLYMETQTATTNVNGLVTLVVGNGVHTPGTPQFSTINWGQLLYLKAEIDPDGGTNYSITHEKPLVSVPYALYAKEMQEGAFSGNYNDLYNRPDIPVLPIQVSAFTNDPPYITSAQVEQQIANAVYDSIHSRLNNLQNQVLNQEEIVDSLATETDSIVNGGFLCGLHKVVDFDGNVYNTVQIDKQCWMRENLRVRHFSDGTEISWGGGVKDGIPHCYRPFTNNFFYPGFTEENTGLHYNWFAVMNGNSASNAVPSGVQGVCPTGWHVPSMGEWEKMVNYVKTCPEYSCNGNPATVGKALAGQSGWYGDTNACAVGYGCSASGHASTTNNKTLMSIMPTGESALSVNHNVYNNYHGYDAKVWSTSKYGDYRRNLYISNTSTGVTTAPTTGSINSPYNAMPVRCVRDEPSYHQKRMRLPVVKTSRAYNLTDTTFMAGCDLMTDGNSWVMEKGVCWSTQPHPTANGPHTAAGGGDKGSFKVKATGLTLHTLYYYRAYATNSVGTAYGEEFSVSTTWDQMDSLVCPDAPAVADNDGNIYSTVKVGDQCWMRENLRTTHFPDGSPIPVSVNWSDKSDSLPYCYPPGKNASNVAQYGYIYNWTAAMNGEDPSITVPSGVRGICPAGWHIPSNDEQYRLKSYVTALDKYRCTIPPSHVWHVSTALASNFGWNSCSAGCTPGYDATANNATGFNLCPAGGIRGQYELGLGHYGMLMTCSLIYDEPHDKYVTPAILLSNDMDWIGGANLTKRQDAAPVRCLQDYDAPASTTCQLPSVITREVSNITATSAAVGGLVVNTGGCNVTERGICWDIFPEPTTENDVIISGEGEGEFSSQLTALTPETEYYVRAYAINDQGTVYGEERHFITTDSVVPGPSVPVVTTYPVTDVTLTSATSGGIVTSDGGAFVSEYGLCWGYNPNPTINNFHVALGMGVNNFTYTMENLYMSLPYHVRAYAVNSQGVSYGEDMVFQTATPNPQPFNQICPGTSVVFDYDSNVYNTVRIGNQCWMRESLRTTHYNDGTEIPLLTWNANTPGRYSPGGSSNNVTTYGYLYNWYAVMGGASSSQANPSGVQGICPVGWHVPSAAEFTQLNSYVGSQVSCRCNGYSQNVAVALCDLPTVYWNFLEYYAATPELYEICSAWGSYYQGFTGKKIQINHTGFSARGAGLFHNGSYDNIMASAEFWTATSTNNGNPRAMILQYTSSEMMSSNSYSGDCGFSVRCVRDLPVSCPPTVYTNTVKSIYATTAQAGGEITHNGGASVTNAGLVWATTPNPTLADSSLSAGIIFGTFTESLSGLQPSTTYYVRAFVTTATDTVYGNEVSFYTTTEDIGLDGWPCMGASTVTDYDGNNYSTIQLGNQCWMRENLRTTHFPNGADIPVTSTEFSDEIPYRYYPDNSTAYVYSYGYLYNWRAVCANNDTNVSSVPSGIQGICPTGWHIPSHAEWDTLRLYLSSRSNYNCDQVTGQVGKAMASTLGWNLSNSECYVGEYQMTNNASGFEAYPAGLMIEPPGNMPIFPRYFGVSAVFWSTTNNSTEYKRTWQVRSAYSTFNYTITKKSSGASVRCLKD